MTENAQAKPKQNHTLGTGQIRPHLGPINNIVRTHSHVLEREHALSCLREQLITQEIKDICIGASVSGAYYIRPLSKRVKSKSKSSSSSFEWSLLI